MIFINVYDFDNTIYNGESMLDFYMLCLKKHPVLAKYIFVMLFNLIRYKLCLVSEEKFLALAQKYAKRAVTACPDAQELAELFWQKNIHKIQPWYKEVSKPDDVVVSASFSFLLKPAMERLGIKCCVSSEIDLRSGEISKICYGSWKVKCFDEKFPNAVVENFYTDSMNDKAFMLVATKDVYIVKKGRLRLYNIEKNNVEEFENE